jgi:hypothetical protein
MWVGGQRHAPAALPPVPILQEAGWAPGPVWVGLENLAPYRNDPRTFRVVASRSIYRATSLTLA